MLDSIPWSPPWRAVALKTTPQQQEQVISKPDLITRDEHGIDTRQLCSSATEVVASLQQAGYEAYIVGGSVREENLDALDAQMAEKGVDPGPLEWYRDLRRFGSVPHAGFGLGLERTVTWISGVHHLREAIPFPRLMGRLHP